ncbi:MAG: PLP-dependent aminotransferase family protein [Solirubrobacteraceae bacterium]|nr:PLP-dependent aminotransferase family protein [Solirubrobacteraceae bacterium]
MADAISFSRGAPSVDIVDIEGLRAAADRAFTNDPAGTTAYGTAVGYVPLRKLLAEKHGVAPEHVVVTNGSMQADAFLFDELVTPGASVVVEKPSYDRTLLGLAERGADLTAIELEADGISTSALRAALEGGLRPTFAHIIPNYQNPGGSTLPLEKRQELIELAEEYDFLIFEDDPYREIRFRGDELPTMYELAPQRVVYASSFSKTVCPGVRVGYLVGAPDLIAKIVRRATNTYIAPDMLAQSVVYELAQDKPRYDAAIANVKAKLRERCDLLADSLEQHLPEAKFVRPDGGYFLWAELPESYDVEAAAGKMADFDVAFVKGSDFLLEGGKSSLRLAYSAVRADQVDEGVQRLAACLNAHKS